MRIRIPSKTEQLKRNVFRFSAGYDVIYGRNSDQWYVNLNQVLNEISFDATRKAIEPSLA